MADAARHVFDAVHETEIGLFVQKNFKDDKQLEVLAHHVVQTSVPVYGKRLNGASLVAIDKELLENGRFRAGGNEYFLHGERTPQFAEISIKRRDLRKAISEIIALSKSLPPNGGYI